MNTTNKDYFTFNVNNSALVVGQTGTGKTELVKAYMRRLEAGYTPRQMKYVLFDLKQCEFSTDFEEGTKKEYLYIPVINWPDKGLDILEDLARLAVKRTEGLTHNPKLLFIYIEECDMAAIDQKRFDDSVITINKHAKQANMKLMYSTSRPSPDVVSKQLIESFELILSSTLALNGDDKYLGVPNGTKIKPYEFAVIERQVTA